MTRLARAFLAVVPTTAVLDALEGRIDALAPTEPRLRWLPRPQWHVTLQFLGGVDDAETLADAVGRAVADVAPFSAQLAGGGAFPSPRRAAVLWVGVEEPDPLAALAGVIGRATTVLGHPPEDRAQQPHLTVARAARPHPVTLLVDELGPGPVGPAWTVREVALEVSDTRPDGAVHTVWARLPLGA